MEIQQTVLFLVQILSLIFLIIYVVKTWEMASATRKAAEATEKSVIEMQATRDQETAPYVIAYFDIPTGSSLVYLVVKNIGHTIATQVKLNFTPPLTTSNNNPPLEEMNFVKNGIESMPPNYEIRTFFDSTSSYFENSELPLSYSVRITYYGGIHAEERTVEQPLDLSASKGLLYIRHKNIHNLVGEIEKLGKESRKIQQATSKIATQLERGILISNTNLVVSKLEPQMKDWKKSLVAKLNEFENLWTISCREERERGINLGRLQSHTLLIGDQILALLANRLDDVSSNISENAARISSRLYELNRIRFYADGGSSLKAFNELGDSIIKEIDDFKKENI